MLLFLITQAFDIKFLRTQFLTKSEAYSPSKAKAFAIHQIMRQKENATVSPDRESKCHFGFLYENSFVLSDDGRHVIGPDASDRRRILMEDLSTGASFRFGENQRNIFTLFFDQDSRTLLAGDWKGHLVEYDLDLQKGQGRTTKKHGDLGIGWIYSSFGSMGLVFFGGSENNVRVYDLARKKMLPGSIETAIRYILSLQVCVVDKSRVYLAVVGSNTNYSSTKSDLYDVTGLLGKVSLPGGLINDPMLLLTQRNPKPSQTQTSEKIKEKLARLEKQLEQKTKDYDALLVTNNQLEKQNKDLTNKNSILEKEKASQEETVSTLLKTNDELNKKLSKAESKVKKYKNRLQEALDQKDSVEAKLRKMKKTSNASISRLGLKLRILNMKLKKITHTNPTTRRQAQNQPDPAEVIRDLEHQLFMKTKEWTDMRNVMRNTIAENTRFETEIEAKAEKIDRLRHVVLNTREAIREG